MLRMIAVALLALVSCSNAFADDVTVPLPQQGEAIYVGTFKGDLYTFISNSPATGCSGFNSCPVHLPAKGSASLTADFKHDTVYINLDFPVAIHDPTFGHIKAPGHLSISDAKIQVAGFIAESSKFPEPQVVGSFLGLGADEAFGFFFLEGDVPRGPSGVAFTASGTFELFRIERSNFFQH